MDDEKANRPSTRLMKSRKAALAFILITVVPDMIAPGIIIPVLPTLILQFPGDNATRAATWLGFFGTVFALLQFSCMPVLGIVSDRVGPPAGYSAVKP